MTTYNTAVNVLDAALSYLSLCADDRLEDVLYDIDECWTKFNAQRTAYSKRKIKISADEYKAAVRAEIAVIFARRAERAERDL